MTDAKSIFSKLNNAVLDLQRANYQTYEHVIKKIARCLSSDKLMPFNDELSDGIDLDSFLETAKASSTGMVGSASLPWPEDEKETLGLQLLIILKFGANPGELVDFAYTFYRGSNNNITSMINNVTSQMIVPFVRDYRAFVEGAGLIDSPLHFSKSSNKIFIVHGHDVGARETVARFIEKLAIFRSFYMSKRTMVAR